MIYCQIGLLEDGSQLKLVGSHLIVTSLAGDAQLQSLYLEVLHEGSHTLGDRTEVVVIHLLVLCAVVAHQCSSGHQQVGTSCIESFIYQEVLLLPSQIAHHLLHIGVEVVCHFGSSLIHSLQSFLQGSLVVKSFAGVGDEHGGNHQRIAYHEYGAGRIPGAVAACFEGAAYAAVGERAGIGFLLHELFTSELLNHSTLPVVLHKAVMLLGSSLGEGLEPVCAVCGTQLHGPLLHAFGYSVGCGHVERRAVVHHVTHLVKDVDWQILVHLLSVEHVLGKVFAGALFAVGYFDGLLSESLSHYLKS